MIKKILCLMAAAVIAMTMMTGCGKEKSTEEKVNDALEDLFG